MSFIVDWWYGSNQIDNFLNNGQLSTNEFKIAGDHLTNICSGWKWSSSLNPNYTFPDLDANKQFLYYKNAICKKRIGQIKESEEVIVKGEDGDEIVMLKYDQAQKEEIDQADVRYYNMYVVYDDKYHCPRMSFTATDIDGKPISNEDIRQDIQKEYLDKTLTVEKFPFLENVSMATVHPCKHANVLKSMADQMREANQMVDCSFALVIFLKFIASVIPHVEFDSTGTIHLK